MEQVLEKPTSELIKEFSTDPLKHVEYTEASMIKSLRALRSYTPLPSERKSKNRTIENIVRQWFSQRMRRKYDELSPEIFELESKIEISKKYFKDKDGHTGYSDEKHTLKIPMLLQAELDREKGWATELEYHGNSYSNVYKLTLFSRIPRAPFDVRKAGRESLVFAYRTYADALDTEVLGDVISEHPDYAPHPDNSKLLVLWKPKPSEIHIEVERIDNDPALILKWDKPYLISTWREPNEEPFMNFISACRIPNLDSFTKRKSNLDDFTKNKR